MSAASARSEGEAPPRTSELLDEIADKGGDESVSLEEIAEVTGQRALGLLLLILALPETIPMIGLSAILAAPIFVLGGVLLIKGEGAPIPEWVGKRSIPREKLRSAIRRSRKVVRWLDRVSHPRWDRVAGAGRLHGAVCVLMAVVLAIPIPGINIVAAFAVAATGVGILQQDGLVAAGGAVAALAALVSFGLVGMGAWSAVGSWLPG